VRFESISRRRRSLSRDEAIASISQALDSFPGIGFDWQPTELRLSWTDGPGPSTVWKTAGEPSGWSYHNPAFYAAAPGVAQVVRMERIHSAAALREAAVRFWAIVERQPDLNRERDVERLARILEADQPMPGSFPIVEGIAASLADGLPATVEDPADYLLRAAKLLEELGYNRLWAEAFRMAE
jgi:hypothetical protein